MLRPVFHVNVRGLPECTELRGQSGEDGADLGGQKKTGLAMNWGDSLKIHRKADEEGSAQKTE
jgi:hypothetical protein